MTSGKNHLLSVRMEGLERCSQKVAHKTILTVYALFVLPLLVLVLVYNQFELQLIFNRWTHPNMDVWIQKITHLGDGLVFLPVLLILFFKDRFSAVQLIFAGIISLCLVSFFKGVVFEDWHRPKAYLWSEGPQYFKDGIRLTLDWDLMKLHHSFPSGHTSSAMAMATVLIMACKRRKWIVFYMFLFVSIALTRVYLNQHFVKDVLFGMFIGLFSGYGAYFLMRVSLCKTVFFRKFVK